MDIAIGIDLGGTRTKIGLVKDDHLIAHAKIKAVTESNLLDHLGEVAEIVDQLMAQEGLHTNDLSGVGLAFPGIVDSQRMKILSRYVKYTDAHALDLKQWAKDRWKIPLVLENDARAALLGEWQYGAGKGSDNLVLVTLGTGVGTAVLIEGKLLRGKHFMAGNLGGHMTINLHGSVCNCGNIGCLESEASTWVLPHQIENAAGYAQSQLAGEKEVNFHRIFALAQQGDDLAVHIRDHCLKAWSLGIISLIHAYDPEKLVIGGGIMQSKDDILPVIQTMVRKHAWATEENIAIVPAVQVEFAGILGVSYLVNQH